MLRYDRFTIISVQDIIHLDNFDFDDFIHVLLKANLYEWTIY